MGVWVRSCHQAQGPDLAGYCTSLEEVEEGADIRRDYQDSGLAWSWAWGRRHRRDTPSRWTWAKQQNN
jgi:hypothetical protein